MKVKVCYTAYHEEEMEISDHFEYLANPIQIKYTQKSPEEVWRLQDELLDEIKQKLSFEPEDIPTIYQIENHRKMF